MFVARQNRLTRISELEGLKIRLRDSHRNRIKVGIIGTGLMGMWHAHAINRSGGLVAGLTDIDMGAADQLAKKYPNAETYSNLHSMLEKCKPDVVHICTPSATHFDLAGLAIEAGAHLMIEKPVTPMVTDTERLFDHAANQRVMICPVYQFMLQDGVLQAKESLPKIGQLVHMEGTFCSAGGVDHPADQVDALVAEILPHPLSLMHQFLPNGLSENQQWTTGRSAPGELRAMTEISGISLSIFISMNARPTVCSFKIMGSNGTIHLDLFHGYAFTEPGKVSKPRKIFRPFDLAFRRFSSASVNLGRRSIRGEPAYPGLQRLVNAFYHAIQNKSRPPISRDAALTIEGVRDLLIQSAKLISSERGKTDYATV